MYKYTLSTQEDPHKKKSRKQKPSATDEGIKRGGRRARNWSILADLIDFFLLVDDWVRLAVWWAVWALFAICENEYTSFYLFQSKNKGNYVLHFCQG